MSSDRLCLQTGSVERSLRVPRYVGSQRRLVVGHFVRRRRRYKRGITPQRAQRPRHGFVSEFVFIGNRHKETMQKRSGVRHIVLSHFQRDSRIQFFVPRQRQLLDQPRICSHRVPLREQQFAPSRVERERRHDDGRARRVGGRTGDDLDRKRLRKNGFF